MPWQQVEDFVNRPLFTLGETPLSLAILFKLLLVIGLALLAARAARTILRTRILARTAMDSGQQFAIARIAGYLILVIGLLVGLSTLGIDLTSLTVLLGALGIGVGLGLQNIINNFVCGLIVLLERPFQIGHRVDVGTTAGTVTRIGARATTIITNDNIAIVVPNSKFIEEPVTNWSLGGDRRVRFRLPVGVSYGSDPRKIERLLLQVAAADPNVREDPAPGVVFLGFGESSLDFELRVWTTTLFDRPYKFKSGLYFSIWECFQREGVEIPFPQREVHVRGTLAVPTSRPPTTGTDESN